VEFRRQCGKMFDLTSHVFLAYIEVHTHIHVHTKTQAHTYTHTHTHTQKLMHIFALHITYQVEITCHMKHFWKRVGQIRANHELLAFVAWQGKKELVEPGMQPLPALPTLPPTRRISRSSFKKAYLCWRAIRKSHLAICGKN